MPIVGIRTILSRLRNTLVQSRKRFFSFVSFILNGPRWGLPFATAQTNCQIPNVLLRWFLATAYLSQFVDMLSNAEIEGACCRANPAQIGDPHAGDVQGGCTLESNQRLVHQYLGEVWRVMKPTFTIFAGTLMALCMAGEAVSFRATDKPSDMFVVPKTVVSTTMRLILEVGLEGSGHHAFGQVLDHMFETNPNLVQISNVHDDFVGDYYTINYSMGQTAQYYSTILSLGRDKMRSLAQQAGALPSPGTVAYTQTEHRFHSYPSGIGPNKALNYLDLRLLAEVAEEEGVDLRVLYLRRSAKQMIIADTVHRGFQT